jgi:hypothetical protein
MGAVAGVRREDGARVGGDGAASVGRIKAAGGTTKELEELPRANSGKVALRKLLGKGPWRLADRWRRDWKCGAPRTSVRR